MTQALELRTESPTRSPGRNRTAAYAATTMILAGAMQTLTGLGTTFLFPAWANPRSAAFVPAGIELTITHAMALAAAVVLAMSSAAGSGWLRRIGFAVALPGLACLVLGESVLRVNFSAGNAFFGAAMPLTAVGMIVVGIAVIQAHVWRGWHRVTPLLCGAYIPLVLVPAFVVAKGPSFPALAGFGFCFLLLGLSMQREMA